MAASSSIVINSFGAFGNNVLQLVHALYHAQLNGIQRVYIGKLTFGHMVLRPALPRRWQGIEIYAGVPPAHVETITDEFYFYPNYDYTVYHDILRNAIRPLLAGLAAPPAPPNHLHISIRSGDLFRGDGANIKYVQPPFAFYQLVIEHHLRATTTPHIIVAYQDIANPCVAALQQYLRNKPHWFVTAPNTDEAVRARSGASNLVVGYGTFAPIVGLIFGNVRRIYGFKSLSTFDDWYGTFNPPFENHFDDLYREHEVILVHDLAGQYITEWQNRPDQRQLILDYPVANLRLAAR